MNHPLKREVIRWRNLFLGYESTEFAEELTRTHHIRSTRSAIERVFRRKALKRWINDTWKEAIVDPDLEHTRVLARIINQELNRGVKRRHDVRFRVEEEEPIVGVERRSRAAVTGDPDLKPDGVTCWYCGEDCWLDVIGFKVTVLRGSGETKDWMPDARHCVKATLVYDCPYESEME